MKHDFNRAASLVLDYLYQSFPNPVMLNIGDLNSNADSDFFHILYSTVKFLEQEGFLRYKQEAGGALFTFCILSIKGLSILNAVPDALEDKKKTLGEKIGDAVKFGSGETVKSLIASVIEFMVKG